MLDLASSDDSVAIARSAGARVIDHDPAPIVELVRNEVAAAATTDWILVVDPDERVTPGLAAALQHAATDDGHRRRGGAADELRLRVRADALDASATSRSCACIAGRR